MQADDTLARWARCFTIAATFIIIVAALKLAQDLIAPMLLAAFLAIICAPPLYWLQAKRVPKGLAVLIVIAGFVALWMGAVVLCGTSLLQLKDRIPAYQQELKEQTDALALRLEDRGIDAPDELLAENFSPGKLASLATSALGQISSLITSAALVLLTAIFILLEASTFPSKLRYALKNPEESLNQFSEIAKNVRSYLAIKTWISLATGVVVTIYLTVIGVEFPVLWGLLSFLLNYIPNIGSLIAAVPAVLIALVQPEGGLQLAIFTTVGFVVVNQIMGNVIEPRVMGRGLGISPLVVFTSLVFWGWALGPVGMLLSVLLTMIIKIACEGFEETRWIAVLLGSDS
jgi:AI-2 transport protein TqsA